MGSLSLLQGIFPTQGSNPGLPHCRWILYQLSHQGSPTVSRGQFKGGEKCRCWEIEWLLPLASANFKLPVAHILRKGIESKSLSPMFKGLRTGYTKALHHQKPNHHRRSLWLAEYTLSSSLSTVHLTES